MKKFYLITLLFAMISTIAGAQTAGELLAMFDGDMYMIPSITTQDGKAVFYLANDPENDDITISILDDDFKIVEEFKINQALLEKYDLINEFGILSEAYGFVRAEAATWEGSIILKDIFGSGYNFMMTNEEGDVLKVFNKDCQEIAHIDPPVGYSFYGVGFNIVVIGKKYYLFAEISGDGEEEDGDYDVAIYRINSNDSSVSLVAISNSAKVSPRAPRKGEKVTVTVDPELVGKNCKVQVVSASGQTVMNTDIPDGQTQLDISTSGFTKGVYVVTVSAEGVSKEAVKIIIR